MKLTSTSDQKDSSPHPSKPSSPWRIFALVAVAVFLVSLDSTIVLAAFPALRDAYRDVTAASLSWVLNAYTIVFAALLVPSGRMADAYGRRRVFLIGLGIFGMASALAAIAPDPFTLSLIRALQAVGAAALTPASLALILVAFPAQKRAAAVGLWGAMGALAAAVGPSVGGWLVEWAGWQSVFWVNVPIVMWSLWRARAGLTESRAEQAVNRIDVVGIALLMSGIGAVVLGLVEVGRWPNELAGATSAVGLTFIALFAWWAHGKPHAAINMDLFRQPTYAWANAATLVFGATFSMMFLGFFLFLTGPWKLSPGEAGLWISPGPLMVVPVAVVAGRMAGRIGHRPLMVIGGLLFAASQFWFASRLQAAPQLLDWAVGLVMSGIGVGLVLPALSGSAVAHLDPHHFGVGNAANSSVRQIGGALGAASAVLIVGEAGASLAQFQMLDVIMGLGGSMTALLSLPIDTRPKPASLDASDAAKLSRSFAAPRSHWLDNRIPPPLVFIVFAGLMGVAAWLLPSFGERSLTSLLIAAAFFILASLTGPTAVRRFIRAKTTINPVAIEQASVLVTDGVYRWTRNPMYLSMAALLAAFAAVSGQPWLWLGPIFFVTYIQRFQIRPEERVMTQLFGDAYSDYVGKVRRWI